VVYSTDITCSKANDGIIIISNETGGSGNYEYSIDGGTTWQRYNTFTGLPPGIYDIKIRDITTPVCVVTLDPARPISEPDAFDPGEIDSSPVEVCINYKPGKITFSALPHGGREPYSYQWYLNGNPITGETGNSIAPSILAVPGSYSYYCKVTDRCNTTGITASKTFTIAEGLGIEIKGAGEYCKNTSVTLSADVTGGSGTISYQWETSTDNLNWTSINGATGFVYSPPVSIPGEIYYRINIVSGGALCNGDALLIIEPLPTATISGTGSVCLNDPPPTVLISGNNGTSPYTFTYNINGGNNQTISTLTGNSSALKVSSSTIGALKYDLISVSDDNGCSSDLSKSLEFEIYDLPAVVITDTKPADCYGDSTGTAAAMAMGGRSPYSFRWSTKPVHETPTVTGLMAGTYTVQVTDAHGCMDSESFTISQPAAALSAVISGKKDVPCPGDFSGSATVTASGGTGPYSFSWDTYPVQGTSEAIGLGMGTYNATISDFNLCTVTVTVVIDPVNKFCLSVPEAFSPDGDGINDVWHINDIGYYPDIVITIYNRWNQMVWRSQRGYPEPWDGRSEGKKLPVDSYHYVIEVKNGLKPYIGTVTIVR